MARSTLGLDIGSSAVRAVALAGGRTPSLVRGGAVELPRGAVEAGSVKNPRAVTEAVRTLWDQARLKGKDVRIGIGSGSVLVRQLELDWMPPADLRKALRFQVADLLPVSINDANIDHITLDEYERHDAETDAPRRLVRILLVATARGAVDEMVRCVQAAGLRPQVADLSALGVVRAAARAGARAGQHAPTEAAIDIGSDKIAVAVHTAGRPHFVRVIAGVGGSLLTQAIVDRAGLSWAEAEQLKHACTLPQPAVAGVHPSYGAAGIAPGAAGTDTQTGAQTDVVGQIVLEAARQLVAEVKATLAFHNGSDQEHAPQRILLTGGGAALSGMSDLLGHTLGLPVQRLAPNDVLPRLGSGRGDLAHLASDPAMVVPLGLALAGGA
ncbi:type IV pilus assembly protein PilM [Nocardioides sp. GY 10113]|uniref:type IV pilus assembly protein PilM n=1 Tax=Nocardioides sp. GY 10113 TaxID=2569761 RepID=UPI0010A7EA15|nr:type IV pilus assembly protein PilM [Nocardioides sp. GY 10113]TIC88430.1 type IV pilus assembly protein PilM [Nocardioides sp. GY 10113]